MSPGGRGATIASMATRTPSEGTHEMVHWEYDPSQEGQGFVTFAGVIIAIAAVLNTLYGIAAIDKAQFFDNNAKYVFGDLATWGWLVLAFGILQFIAAFAIWRGAGWARWFGVACCACNALLQVLWFPSRPVLALTILPLDIIAMYGLLAHGGQRRAAREARGC
jgi:uncharacterized membrane protein (DUF2068 family)